MIPYAHFHLSRLLPISCLLSLSLSHSQDVFSLFSLFWLWLLSLSQSLRLSFFQFDWYPVVLPATVLFSFIAAAAAAAEASHFCAVITNNFPISVEHLGCSWSDSDWNIRVFFPLRKDVLGKNVQPASGQRLLLSGRAHTWWTRSYRFQSYQVPVFYCPLHSCVQLKRSITIYFPWKYGCLAVRLGVIFSTFSKIVLSLYLRWCLAMHQKGLLISRSQ